MTKVFLDTNVFLDFFLDRKGLADAAEILLTWGVEKKVVACTSATNIVNIYYLVKQQKNKITAKNVINRLLSFISIPITNHKDLLLAIDSAFADFEDAVQYYSALNIEGLDYIITRNKKDYKSSSIEVLTAEEFVGKFK